MSHPLVIPHRRFVPRILSGLVNERIVRELYERVAVFLAERAHLRVEFEDAIHSPEATVRRIADFVGRPVTDDALAFVDPSQPKVGTEPRAQRSATP